MWLEDVSVRDSDVAIDVWTQKSVLNCYWFHERSGEVSWEVGRGGRLSRGIVFHQNERWKERE